MIAFFCLFFAGGEAAERSRAARAPARRASLAAATHTHTHTPVFFPLPAKTHAKTPKITPFRHTSARACASPHPLCSKRPARHLPILESDERAAVAPVGRRRRGRAEQRERAGFGGPRAGTDLHGGPPLFCPAPLFHFHFAPAAPTTQFCRPTFHSRVTEKRLSETLVRLFARADRARRPGSRPAAPIAAVVAPLDQTRPIRLRCAGTANPPPPPPLSPLSTPSRPPRRRPLLATLSAMPAPER